MYAIQQAATHHRHAARLSLLFLTAAMLLLGSSMVQAQRKQPGKYKDDYWRTDPYTKNDKAVMQKLGYRSFGPFSWGDDHSSADIAKMFPNRHLLFVETAHFRIISSLPAYALPRGAKLEKKLLKADLTELKRVLPRLKPTRRKLDPWLRLHLYALRLERIYAEISRRLQVRDADFPKTATKRVTGAKSDNYMGQGPILGMRNKFLVLLLHKGASLNRYIARARPGAKTTGRPLAQRFYFIDTGSLFFGTSCECGEGSLFNDHALHCHVVFSTVHMLIDGYKDFFFELPVWWREGLAHWHVHRIDPEQHCYTGMKGRSNLKKYDHRWEMKIKRRLKHDDVSPARQITRYMKFHDLTFGDHMAAWSRVDFLLSLGDDKFARFMALLKNPIEVPAGTMPSAELVCARQSAALKQAYGFDDTGFDAAWKAYALAKYPNR